MNAPAKTVAVPMTALYDLFDMGNYGHHRPGDERAVSALDLARNVIRHAAIELEVLGKAVNSSDPEMFDDDVSTHCHRVAAQLHAALQIVDALDDGAPVPTEGEVAQ